MGRPESPHDLRGQMAFGIGFTGGFALVGLLLFCHQSFELPEQSGKAFFESLEDFGVLLTAFVTAATVFAAAAQLQDNNKTRADARISEHTQMALGEAKAFHYWIGATYNEAERPLQRALTLRGFKGFQQALRLRGENSFGGALIKRHEVHCRQSELLGIVDRFRGIRDDLDGNRLLLSAERYDFFRRLLDLAHVEEYLAERRESHKTQWVHTRRLAEEVRDGAAEADLLALVDSGYLVFVNRDGGNSEILNMSIFPWETVDGLLPMTKETSMSASEFLAYANNRVSELRQGVTSA